MTVNKRGPNDPPVIRAISFPERVKWMKFIAECCEGVFNPHLPLGTGDRASILAELGRSIREWICGGLTTFKYYSAPDERTITVDAVLPSVSGFTFLLLFSILYVWSYRLNIICSNHR
jgi:hypothetical protein